MLPDRHPFVNGTPKIGVYVCHCGTNISDKVDVEEVARWAAEKLRHRGVIVARDYKFMCSSLGQNLIEDDIREFKLNRVVVAACSPHLHEHTFRTACARAGLNPFLCEMVSIREHVSWVHTDRAEATAKAKELISGGVERVRHHVPLDPLHVEVNPNTLVVGGGISNTFVAAAGNEVGNSLHEKDLIPEANRLRAATEVIFATDVTVTKAGFDAWADDTPTEVKKVDEINADEEIVDYGPETAARVAEIIKSAKTILWNGPCGVFEFDAFAKGTEIVSRAIAASDA